MEGALNWLTLAVWLLLGGAVLGTLIEQARERTAWRKLAVRVWTTHPMSTQPPTVTELNRPDWLSDES